MNWAERMLAIIAGLLLVGAGCACYFAASAVASNGGSPFAFFLSQLVYDAAPLFASVGLGTAAGLLFLRGLRWQPQPDHDEG